MAVVIVKTYEELIKYNRFIIDIKYLDKNIFYIRSRLNGLYYKLDYDNEAECLDGLWIFEHMNDGYEADINSILENVKIKSTINSNIFYSLNNYEYIIRYGLEYGGIKILDTLNCKILDLDQTRILTGYRIPCQNSFYSYNFNSLEIDFITNLMVALLGEESKTFKRLVSNICTGKKEKIIFHDNALCKFIKSLLHNIDHIHYMTKIPSGISMEIFINRYASYSNARLVIYKGANEQIIKLLKEMTIDNLIINCKSPNKHKLVSEIKNNRVMYRQHLNTQGKKIFDKTSWDNHNIISLFTNANLFFNHLLKWCLI